MHGQTCSVLLTQASSTMKHRNLPTSIGSVIEDGYESCLGGVAWMSVFTVQGAEVVQTILVTYGKQQNYVYFQFTGHLAYV